MFAPPCFMGGDLLLQVEEGLHARILGDVAQFLFDAEQLVVLGHAIRAARRAGLDLAGVEGHGDVGDGRVFGLAGAVRNDGGVAGAVGHLDGVQRLGQGADLVDLDEDGVADMLLNAGGQTLDVGDEQVVADQLHAVADGLGQHRPAFPVRLGHAVFEGDDRIGVGEARPHIHQLLLRQLGAGLGLDVALLLLIPPLGGSGVDGDLEVLAGLVAGLLDGLHDDLEGVLVLGQVGGVAAFVAHARGGSAVLLEHGLEGVEHLGAAAQGFLEGGRGDRHDHELLDLHVVGGVRAAVQDVHHRHGQLLGVDAADVVVQRQAHALRGGLGAGQGHAEDGVGAQLGLVRGAVQFDELLVNGGLIEHVLADEGVRDLGVDVLHGSQNALAVVAALVAVTQFAGLVNAGGSAGGHGGAADGAILEDNFDFHGGISAAVEDLAADDIDDLKNLFHGYRSPFQCERNTSAWMGCAANLRPGTGRRPFITIQNYKEMKSLCQAHSGKQRAEMCLRAALFRKFYPGAGESASPPQNGGDAAHERGFAEGPPSPAGAPDTGAGARPRGGSFLSRPVAAGAQNWK